MSCFIKLNIEMNRQLAGCFNALARKVLKHKLLCIFGTIGFMNAALFGSLLGHAELRNEETLLPSDAEELVTQAEHRDLFGFEWGNSNVLARRADGGDILTEAGLRQLAELEDTVLGLTVDHPDDGYTITYTPSEYSTCESIYGDARAGASCFYISFFGPGTPWNNDASGFTNASVAYSNFLTMADTLAAANPTSTVDKFHLAATQFYNIAKGDMFRLGVVGGVETNSQGEVTKMTDASMTFVMRGIERKQLKFDLWDIVSDNLPKLDDVERWETRMLDWGEENEVWTASGGLKFNLNRYTTRSTSMELLQMALGSMWLVCLTMSLMFSYVMFVFAKQPYREHLFYRAKLAMAGVGGVMISANSGIFFSTFVQIPLTFASQFVMFIVLGIGLDGVFLITDHFDMEPAVSASSGSRRLPRERVISAVTKAGPSVLIASTTDVLAFMSCVFTPVPVIRYFCMTVSIALLICLCLLFTWYISWLDRLTSAHEDKMIANKLAEAVEKHLQGVNGPFRCTAKTSGWFGGEKEESLSCDNVTDLADAVRKQKITRETVVECDGFKEKSATLPDAIMNAPKTSDDVDVSAWVPSEPISPPGTKFFEETIGPCLEKNFVKALVCIGAVVLTATAPIGLVQVEPGWGIEDFVNGCGVICNPSYLIAWSDQQNDNFVTPPDVVTLAFKDFNINTDKALYDELFTLLLAGNDGYPAPIAQGDTDETCPTSCIDSSFQTMSIYGQFCAQYGCNATTSWTQADLQAFVAVQPGVYRFLEKSVSSLDNSTATTLTWLRVWIPLRSMSETRDSMKSLQAVNDIIEKMNGKGLDVSAYSRLFPLYSMFVRISSMIISSLLVAMAVAFVVLLLSVHVTIAVVILIIVVMVDTDLFAAIHFFDNYLGPFSFAAVVISVGLCLDYSIHVAQEFSVAGHKTGNERMKHAVGHVGRAVFNGGFTTFFGMGVLACGPGKPFYGFGSLFCYMVFLGLYHGLLVLPVVLSVLNPKSIAEAFEMNLTVEVAQSSYKVQVTALTTVNEVKVMVSSQIDAGEAAGDETGSLLLEDRKFYKKADKTSAELPGSASIGELELDEPYVLHLIASA